MEHVASVADLLRSFQQAVIGLGPAGWLVYALAVTLFVARLATKAGQEAGAADNEVRASDAARDET